MKNIPYYDFSTFPVNSNNFLNIINSAVNEGFSAIFINFGEYFPWSLDILKKSNLTYSEKLIETIVNICNKNEITLIPVLSILTNSDFILEDKKYKYLRNDGVLKRGINILSCGVSKLVEQLHDDLFSLLIYSDYLVIELPDFSLQDNENNLSNKIGTFIKRVTNNLEESGKQLILGWHKNCQYDETMFESENIIYISKNNNDKTNIFKSNSYNLETNESKIQINNEIYILSKLDGTDGFYGGYDIGYFIAHFKADNKEGLFLEISRFYSLLNDSWYQIRISWEKLSYIYRSTNINYRISFSRSVLLLNEIFENLKTSGFIILNKLEEYYQPGVLRIWMNSKLDSVSGQKNKLEDISNPMCDGFKL